MEKILRLKAKKMPMKFVETPLYSCSPSEINSWIYARNQNFEATWSAMEVVIDFTWVLLR
jgi:hypothetical protein